MPRRKRNLSFGLDAFESDYTPSQDGIYLRLACWLGNALFNGTLTREAIEDHGVELPAHVILQVTGLRSPQKARATASRFYPTSPNFRRHGTGPESLA